MCGAGMCGVCVKGAGMYGVYVCGWVWFGCVGMCGVWMCGGVRVGMCVYVYTGVCT